MMKKIVILVLSMTLFVGCAALNKQQKGTIAGSAGGALIGAAVSKGSVWGILAGAAVGGIAGNLIGKKMDAQARDLNQAVPSAEVNRVGEGINMTFDTSLAFKVNSSVLSESYKNDLTAAAQVFKSYPDTNILIEGHTDDSGAAAYNLTLSEKRAKSVSSYFISQGVDASRLTTKWYGETQPKFANDDASRAKNRRVELGIYANDDMKEDAKSKKLN
jgi:outer membrane protein OmpA-like peptidoglycan-associated protein